MENFNGYLFSKLFAIGSKLEGPIYFLQQFDYKELMIEKKGSLWNEDPNLHPFLGQKVTIEGEINNNKVYYSKIKAYKPSKSVDEKQGLIIDLELGTDILWVNRMPADTVSLPYLALTLLVKWPYKSIWQGLCPTSQQYDFFIEYEDKIIWRWSANKVFTFNVTPVFIPGASFHRFPEVWEIYAQNIVTEGKYTARAIFIASGQEVTKDFQIKFAK